MPLILTNEIIEAAIEGFEVQKRRIDDQIAELKSMRDGHASPAPFLRHSWAYEAEVQSGRPSPDA